MKYLLSFLLVTSGLGIQFASGQNIFRTVAKDVYTRMRQKDGTWGPWVDFMNENEVHCKITLDLQKAKIYWDMKDPKGDLGIYVSTIDRMEYDSTYNCCGLSIAKLYCTNEDHKARLFYLFFVGETNTQCGDLFLLEKGTALETRYHLLEMKEP